MRVPPRAAAVLLLVYAGAALLPARAEHDRGAFPLDDRLQILVRPRSVLAIDGETGGQREEALDLGERITAQGSDGRVGYAISDRRILAISAGSGAFQEARFSRGEALTAPAALADRLVLFVTNRRVIGFDGGSGNLVESRLGPRERVDRTAIANSVGVVVTSRRALGLSPFRGGFFEVSLGLDEAGRSEPTASGDVVTLVTASRILIFRADTGAWEERQLGLGN